MENEFNFRKDDLILDAYFALKRIALSDREAFGLDPNVTVVETGAAGDPEHPRGPAPAPGRAAKDGVIIGDPCFRERTTIALHRACKRSSALRGSF